MLAKLLKADLLPTVWIPPENQRHVRELLTHRARLVRQRTAVINELRAVYAKRNIDPQAKLGRAQPQVSGAEDLSGYAPRIWRRCGAFGVYQSADWRTGQGVDEDRS